MKTTKLIRRQG